MTEKFKAYWRVDQPEIPVEGFPTPEGRPTMLTIFDVDVHGATVLAGFCHGSITSSGMKSAPYGQSLVARIGAMTGGDGPMCFAEVKAPARAARQVVGGLLTARNEGGVIVFLCADDETKTAAMRELDLRPIGEAP